MSDNLVTFGVPSWDDDLEAHVFHVTRPGFPEPVVVWLDDDPEPSVEFVKHVAEQVFSREAELMSRIAQSLVTRFERQNPGKTVEAAVLMSHLKLETIRVLDDGSADLYLRAEAFFAQHVIIVELTNDHQFAGVSLDG